MDFEFVRRLSSNGDFGLAEHQRALRWCDFDRVDRVCKTRTEVTLLSVHRLRPRSQKQVVVRAVPLAVLAELCDLGKRKSDDESPFDDE